MTVTAPQRGCCNCQSLYCDQETVSSAHPSAGGGGDGGRVPHSVHWGLCPVGMEMAFISSAGSQPIRNVSLALIPLQALRGTGYPPLSPPTHPAVLPFRRLPWQTQHLTGLSDVDVWFSKIFNQISVPRALFLSSFLLIG